MPTIWQKMKKPLVQFASDSFFGWFQTSKNLISGTRSVTSKRIIIWTALLDRWEQTFPFVMARIIYKSKLCESTAAQQQWWKKDYDFGKRGLEITSNIRTQWVILSQNTEKNMLNWGSFMLRFLTNFDDFSNFWRTFLNQNDPLCRTKACLYSHSSGKWIRICLVVVL